MCERVLLTGPSGAGKSTLLRIVAGALDFDAGERVPGHNVEIAYFAQAPVWSNAAWALGVWGALAGSILLLARSRYAVMAVAVAIVGLLGVNIWQYAISDMPDSLRNPGLTVAIWITTLFMLFYASRMTRAGVLR